MKLELFTGASRLKEDQESEVDTFDSIRNRFSYLSYHEDKNKQKRVREDLLERLSKLVNTEEDIVKFLKSGLLYDLSGQEVLNCFGDKFRKFVKDHVQFKFAKGGESISTLKDLRSEGFLKINSFNGELRGAITNHPAFLRAIAEVSPDSLIESFEALVSQIPVTRFNIRMGSMNPIKMGAGGHDAVDHLEYIIHLAKILEQIIESSEDLTQIVFNSKASKSLDACAIAEVEKLIKIHEADVYSDPELFKFFNSTWQFNDFLSNLIHILAVTKNGDKLGKKIFNWIYKFLNDGSVHQQKDKLLKSMARIMSSSFFSQLVQVHKNE